MYGMSGKKLQRHYKDFLSDFKQWEEKGHAKEWLVFPENIGPYLSIDETALSKGELYTIITNKKAKGKKGALVGMFHGTKVEPIIDQLLKIPAKKRAKVKEITLDMANSMKTISSKCFPKAIQVTDRFHVQKLAIEALQDLRIKYRWEALDRENEQIRLSKTAGKEFKPMTFSNGDSSKQLLARSRYLLYKSPDKWTPNQIERGQILFKQYPVLKKAYALVQGLRNIFNQVLDIKVAYTKLAHWYNDVEESGFKSFQTVANSIALNYQSVSLTPLNCDLKAFIFALNDSAEAFVGSRPIVVLIQKPLSVLRGKKRMNN